MIYILMLIMKKWMEWNIEKNIELACNNSWQYRGNAAKNVVDFLIAKQAEVIKEC